MSRTINEKAIRSTIKRLFDNSIYTIISELLQNAQRSGAKNFWISTTKTTIICQDDGSGIESFEDLLVLGNSNYDSEVLTNQNPMGFGFHSLLANDLVNKVTVVSGGKQIVIDPRRWWELEYAQNWSNLVTNSLQERGTIIEVDAQPEFLKRWTAILKEENQSCYQYRDRSPARGYFLVNLKVWLDGIELDNNYKYLNRNPVLLEASFQGSNLKVFSPGEGKYHVNQGWVNWYGQVVKINSKIPFDFLLEVKEGEPLSLKAPVRDGVIYNGKWQAFEEYLVNKIVDLFANPKYIPTLGSLQRYNELQKSFCNLPNSCYFVAKQVEGYTQENGYADIKKGKPVLLKYEDKPTIIDYSVMVLTELENGKLEFQERDGVESFVPLLERPVYTSFDNKANKELKQTIFWKPGKAIATKYESELFYEVGEYAIAEFESSATWLKVTKDVYAIADQTYGSLDAVNSDEMDWKIGVNANSSPVEALASYYYSALESDADEDDFRRYNDEINDILVTLGNKILKSNLRAFDIQWFFCHHFNLDLDKQQKFKRPGIIFNDDCQTATLVCFYQGEKISVEDVRLIE